MANNNNIYYNAAYCGFLRGAFQGRSQNSVIAADYSTIVAAAKAFAQEVDAGIPEDALVTTGGGDPSQLAITTNTIAADEQFRAGLLQDLCYSQIAERFTTDATAADYANLAAVIKAMWTEGLTQLVTP